MALEWSNAEEDFLAHVCGARGHSGHFVAVLVGAGCNNPYCLGQLVGGLSQRLVLSLRETVRATSGYSSKKSPLSFANLGSFAHDYEFACIVRGDVRSRNAILENSRCLATLRMTIATVD